MTRHWSGAPQPNATAAAAAAGGRCRAGRRCRSGRASRAPRAGRASSAPAASMPASRSSAIHDLLPAVGVGREAAQLDLPRFVDAALGLGDVERELQAAQLVDQAGLLGVDAGEDAAARRRVEAAAVELARLADLAREVGVDLVELALDRRRAAPWSAAGRPNTCRHWCRPPAARRGRRARSSSSGRHRPDAEHADRGR